MSAVVEPSAAEQSRDALAELVNVGAGHALTALSALLGGVRVEGGVPQVLRAAAFGPALSLRRPAMSIALDLYGGAAAQLWWLLEDPTVRRLSAQLLGSTRGEVARLEILSDSALLELGNVTASAFCDAWAKLLAKATLPGPPRAWKGDVSGIVRQLAEPADAVLVVMPVTFASSNGAELVIRFQAAAATRLLGSLGVPVDLGF